jgi:hypothetical protein
MTSTDYSGAESTVLSAVLKDSFRVKCSSFSSFFFVLLFLLFYFLLMRREGGVDGSSTLFSSMVLLGFDLGFVGLGLENDVGHLGHLDVFVLFLGLLVLLFLTLSFLPFSAFSFSFSFFFFLFFFSNSNYVMDHKIETTPTTCGQVNLVSSHVCARLKSVCRLICCSAP